MDNIVEVAFAMGFLSKEAKKKEEDVIRYGRMTGAGKGKGMPGGGRRNKNVETCPTGGPGKAKGKGRGKGAGRKKADDIIKKRMRGM